MKTTFLITAALAVLTPMAFAAPAHTTKAAPTAKAAALVCPVTGNKIASAKAAFGHSTYKGKTYYFCCPACKPRFDKAPAKIVANAAKGKYEKM